MMKSLFLATLLTLSAGAAPRGQQVNIKIGTATFTATLDDTPAAKAFKARLPLTIRMSDLHRNEKFFDLLTGLPIRAVHPGTIRAGDLMLYGDRTVVLFYRSFPTSYTYTRLGRIHDPQGLAAAVGSGDVTVTFKLKKFWPEQLMSSPE
ncbi:cyclophilin-like fold protein [Deinococcus navajonensis]|uniref:Cyclophilin-like fold protein n=1 Tax=Deinococcus navajonensis TaxID=309884 RepID=A0ABV8XNX4_9DEIO